MTISTLARAMSSIGAALLALTVVAVGVAPIASAATCSLVEGTDFSDNTTLQNAITGVSGISCASDGDVITVTFSSDTTRGGVFTITSLITYSGPADLVLAGNPAAATTLDGSNTSAIIYSGSGSAQVTISALILTNANSSRGAGEIYGNLIATNATLSNNTSSGYGFRVRGGNGTTAVSLDSVNVTGNTSANGGAGLYVDLGDVSITHSSFTGNTVTGSGKQGGALTVYAGDATISSTVFSGNRLSGGGSGAGGAIYIKDGLADATITGSQFTDNSATGSGAGGAIRVAGGASHLTVVNSTFTGNVAGGSGGAINAGAAADISFSTFSENDAQGAGQISGQVAGNLVRSTGNIFTSSIGESCVAVSWTSNYSIATTGDAFCANGVHDTIVTVAGLDLAGMAPYPILGGLSARVPSGTSPAVALVPASAAAALPTPVTDDQGGIARNGAWYTAGAVQIDCPDEPTIDSAAPGSESASITLTAPAYTAGGAIRNFQYSMDGGAWTDVSPATATGPFTITGLTGGQTYGVRIRAVIDGPIAGRASASASVTPTSSGQAPTIVRSLRVTTSRPAAGTATLVWVAPANAGAYPVTRYTVRVRMAPNTDYETVSTPTAVTANLRNLVRGRLYYIRVRATNATGNGPAALLKLRF